MKHKIMSSRAKHAIPRAMLAAFGFVVGWKTETGETASPGSDPRKTVQTDGVTNIVLDTRSYWRCFQMLQVPVEIAGSSVRPLPHGKGVKPISSPPPAHWTQPDFDDSDWWRAPGPFYEGYGFQPTEAVALLCLRGRFSVDDPSKVKTVQFSCRYRGGIVVYLNGREVTRANLPEGPLAAETPATAYPIEAYVQTNGTSVIRWGWGEPERFKDRCELRLRTLQNLRIPTELLRKGINVLAVEIHRSPFAEEATQLKEWWAGFRSHAGIDSIQLRTDSPDNVRGTVCRPSGFQLWNAPTVMAVFDMDYGDPYTPLRPIRIYGARNGSFSGQVVASADTAIRGLKASMGELVHTEGKGRISVDCVYIRYAKPGGPEAGANVRYGTAEVNRFDALEETAPAEVPIYEKRQGIKPCGAVQPIWVTVSVPSNAVAGGYTGTLTISAEGQQTTAVPVVLTVADWTLPDPRDYVTFVDMIQSPESVALQYEVPLWSHRHWDLVAKSFRQLARVGNKTVYIPLICRTHFGNSEGMVRWVRLADGAYAGDFTVMEKYLDIVQRYLGKPEVVCFYVWEGWLGGGYFSTKDGSVDRARVKPLPVSLLDPQTGVVTMFEGPTYFDPEAEGFLRPIAEELRERMKKRGWEGAIMLGISGDVRPSEAIIELWRRLLPEAKWVSHGHGFVHKLGNVPVGYVTTVWMAAYAPDPDERRLYGWRREGHPNKPKGQAFAQYNRDMVFDHNLIEHRMLAENNIAGNQVGFGRNGADFWPVLKDKTGRPISTLAGRYPESSWAQLSVKTCLLAPGPDGAISTVRWEMIVEGVQECEARIFIEKALLDKEHREKLGEETAARLQVLLDERTRTAQCGPGLPGWFVSSGWQERSARLYAAAGEVAQKLGAGK
ncbi:MAG: DUF6067 family protein [Kiritimatiellae bacterium]|nr:DUF6067 family protein [Kiritimatiellia bacterium]